MEDKTKKYLIWAIIVAVLAVAYSALSYVNTYGKSVEPGSYRSFSVTGQGKVTVVPDVARFTFSVITEGGQDLAALQTDNTSKVNKAIDFLKGKGVEAKDIKTEGYNVSPRYQNVSCSRSSYIVGAPTSVCPPPAIVGYSINQTVGVKVRDFSIIGGVLSGVVSSGANNVSQLAFTVDDPTTVENEARAQAIKQAEDKARLMARAGGFGVGRLISIDEGGYPTPYYGYGKGILDSAGLGMGGDAQVAPPPTIEPGSQEVQITVNLRYEID